MRPYKGYKVSVGFSERVSMKTAAKMRGRIPAKLETCRIRNECSLFDRIYVWACRQVLIFAILLLTWTDGINSQLFSVASMSSTILFPAPPPPPYPWSPYFPQLHLYSLALPSCISPPFPSCSFPDRCTGLSLCWTFLWHWQCYKMRCVGPLQVRFARHPALPSISYCVYYPFLLHKNSEDFFCVDPVMS